MRLEASCRCQSLLQITQLSVATNTVVRQILQDGDSGWKRITRRCSWQFCLLLVIVNCLGCSECYSEGQVRYSSSH